MEKVVQRQSLQQICNTFALYANLSFRPVPAYRKLAWTGTQANRKPELCNVQSHKVQITGKGYHG